MSVERLFMTQVMAMARMRMSLAGIPLFAAWGESALPPEPPCDD